MSVYLFPLAHPSTAYLSSHGVRRIKSVQAFLYSFPVFVEWKYKFFFTAEYGLQHCAEYQSHSHVSHNALLVSKCQQDVTITCMTTSYKLHLAHLGDAFIPRMEVGWMDNFGRPMCHLCIHPGPWHDSRVAYVCVCVCERRNRPLHFGLCVWLKCGIYWCTWKAYEDARLDRAAAANQSASARPDQTSSGLIYGLMGASVKWLHRLCSGDVALRWWKRTFERKTRHDVAFHWDLGVSLPQLVSVYFIYLLVGEMCCSGSRDCELSLFVHAICDVTYNPSFNPRKVVCMSVSCMTK